jgi:hypothetical protein
MNRARNGRWCSAEATRPFLLFTVMDTRGKELTGRYPVPQVVWARYFFQLALMLLIPRVGFMDLQGSDL